MALLKVHDKQFKPFISAEQINEHVKKVATQIKEWNNLPDDNLKVGQQLIISTSK